ncbi:MAG: lytic transglycosylase domain-containing protein [Acinetobacter sp.]
MNYKYPVLLITVYLLGNCLTQSLSAGQIYTYHDRAGTPLFTNRQQNDSQLKKVKVTYYPDSNIHNYRNWGNSEASVLPSFNKNKNAFDDIIRQAAEKHRISAGLIKAIMHTESGFNVNARSPVGAQGLMQLMPATAKRFNVSQAYEPKQNIMGAAKYLSFLIKRFDNNLKLVLAAYNAGEGNVDKYGGIPPFRETQDYVQRVLSRYQHLYADDLKTGTNSNTSLNVLLNDINRSPKILSANSDTTKIIQRTDGTYTNMMTH